jgi:hypothetical protein
MNAVNWFKSKMKGRTNPKTFYNASVEELLVAMRMSLERSKNDIVDAHRLDPATVENIDVIKLPKRGRGRPRKIFNKREGTELLND